MEEQKKELKESAEDTVKKESAPEAQPTIPTRSFVLWILGGLYIVYTGYQLCKGYLDGAEGSSLVFFIVGVVFVLIGGFLAIKGFSGTSKQEKAKKAAEEAQRTEIMAETSAGDPTEAPRKMSIKDRANLASSLNVTEEEDATPDEETAE